MTTDIQFNQAAFFDEVRESLFGGQLNQTQVDNFLLLGQAIELAGLHPIIEQSAYIFATVYHETARTMAPIEEYGGKRKHYAPWYGRGHVQLTWEDNYKKQEKKLGQMSYVQEEGIPYKVHQDKRLALNHETSSLICVLGMRDGDFTGKDLNDYIRPGSVDYVNARRIVNGTDKASTIAGYAAKFEKAVAAGFEGMEIPGAPPAPEPEGGLHAMEITRAMVASSVNRRHPHVRIAQGLLYGYGYNIGHRADGIAGPSFDRAVKQYQRDNGLAADGLVGKDTWTKLES